MEEDVERGADGRWFGFRRGNGALGELGRFGTFERASVGGGGVDRGGR